MPFSGHLSAKFCIMAAMSIAQAFEAFPYPNTSGLQTSPAQTFSNSSKAPRTMPAFACCAIQSSYAMLMLFRKTRATNEGSLYGRNDQMVSSLLRQPRQGLEKVVGALENYSLSFESLSGMRGKYQIKGAAGAALHDIL
ncbi:hypothetical protein ABVK25_009567 [Lepraria finkii]|uniref:Uncharacterized protein n=1 Tax=Lepraria finkii TaxID=1340010 RepID=A0ABR4AZT3_9LECA